MSTSILLEEEINLMLVPGGERDMVEETETSTSSTDVGTAGVTRRSDDVASSNVTLLNLSSHLTVHGSEPCTNFLYHLIVTP